MALPFGKSIQPHTLRGALLIIFVALLGVAYDLITKYTVGGVIVGVLLVVVAFLIALLILAPYLSSNDPGIVTLIKELQQIDDTLLPYLPMLIRFLPVIESAIQQYGPDFATILNQLLAEQAQKMNIKPLSQAK